MGSNVAFGVFDGRGQLMAATGFQCGTELRWRGDGDRRSGRRLLAATDTGLQVSEEGLERFVPWSTGRLDSGRSPAERIRSRKPLSTVAMALLLPDIDLGWPPHRLVDWNDWELTEPWRHLLAQASAENH